MLESQLKKSVKRGNCIFGTRSSSVINKSELVVNQEPDIPLKVELRPKSPHLYKKKRIEHNQKLSNTKKVLEILMEKEKDHYEMKLKKQKDKLKKIMENEEYDEQVRIMKIEQ